MHKQSRNNNGACLHIGRPQESQKNVAQTSFTVLHEFSETSNSHSPQNDICIPVMGYFEKEQYNIKWVDINEIQIG